MISTCIKCGTVGPRGREVPAACPRCQSTGLEPRYDPDPGGLRVFVYGTLRPSLRLPFAERAFGKGKASEFATLDGRLYARSYPWLVPGAGAPVVGELVAVGAEDMEFMDMVEFGAGYVRERHAVITAAGGAEEAWVYAWRAPVPRGATPVATGDFADHLRMESAYGGGAR